MKKSSLVAAGVAVALTVGTVGVADAASSHSSKISNASVITKNVAAITSPTNPIATVLAALVANGTITQTQSTAIMTALTAAKAAMPQPSIAGGPDGDSDGPGYGGHGPRGLSTADQATILSTLGITAADLTAAKAAGKSLATLAGSKTQALINALVAQKTTEINAKVTAKTLTQAQATTLIAGLTAKVTEMVNATPGQGADGPGRGHGHGGPGAGAGFAPAPGAPSVGGNS
jgi:hypothetical protein